MSEEASSVHIANKGTSALARPPGLATRIGQAFMLAWRPIPVEPPIIDSDLQSLSAIERVAEVLRFNALSFEFSVSPKGGLRAWLKLNFLVGLVLAIPALTLIPVITFILNGFATWTQFLVQIADNLLHTAGSIFLLILLVVVGGRVLLWQFPYKRGHRR